MAAWRHSWTILVTFLVFDLIEATVLNITEDSENENTKSNLLQLLQIIHEQRYVSNLVLYRASSDNSREESLYDELLGTSELRVPVIIANAESTHSYKTLFSSEIVVLICEFEENYRHRLKSSPIVQELLNSRFIIYMKHRNSNDIQAQIEDYCEASFTSNIYNILIIFENFGSTDTYYNCRRYSPDQSMYRTKLLNESVTIYESQFSNMYGGVIYTFSDQIQPRTILVYDSDGKVRMDGYVGKLITVFAEKRNATLVYKYPPETGVKTSEDDMLLILRNGSLDIASMLATHVTLKNFNDVTYPYEYVSYCFMIPLPNAIPKNKIFTSIIRIHVLLVIFILFITFAALLTYSLNKSSKEMSFTNVFLNDKSIRGLLGQPFTMIAEPSFNTQFICFLLCYTSLLITTMYQAYLQASFTSPPTEPMVRSYRDIETAGLKIFIWRGELFYFNATKEYEEDPHYFEKYNHIMQVTDNYTEFIMHRASLNTQYVYPVTRTRWLIFIEQQRLFGRPLFLYSGDICLYNFAILGIAVRTGLPYRELFEDHILRIRESGIFAYWFLSNIYDMVETNLTSLKALRSTQRYGEPIALVDFYWIWLMYLLNIMLCLVGFVWEIGTWRLKSRANMVFCNNTRD